MDVKYIMIDERMIISSSIETLDDYFIKDMLFVEDNIVVLVKPREQYLLGQTEEYPKKIE